MSNPAGDLQRFHTAQGEGSRCTYAQALRELQAGCKQSHWIWFVFPQLRGLGHSATAQRFGITSLAEAQAYLAHPVLGPRLEECARLLAGHRGRTAQQILGRPDDLKVRSSMTLFSTLYGAVPPLEENTPSCVSMKKRYRPASRSYSASSETHCSR